MSDLTDQTAHKAQVIATLVQGLNGSVSNSENAKIQGYLAIVERILLEAEKRRTIFIKTKK